MIRIKNRFDPVFRASAESGGYRDMLLNVRLDNTHVCEVQVQVQGFLKIKSGGGHRMYSLARSLHLLDPELGHVRVSVQGKDQGKQQDRDAVREQIRKALDRVEGGTCFVLALNHVKLSVAECAALGRALRSAACCVQQLSLAYCGIDSQEESTALAGGEQEAGAPSQLVHVNLQGNKSISGAVVRMVVLSEVEELVLQDCKLDGSAVGELIEVLGKQERSVMRQLNLFGNTLGHEEAMKLAGVVPKLLRLKTIDLGGERYMN